MGAIGAARRGYTCHRAETRRGFRHGDGTRKRRQDWSIGQTVSVGFLRDLTVISEPDPIDGDYYGLMARTGVLYGFRPHDGLFRLSPGDQS
jgi:hypothetical protein